MGAHGLHRGVPQHESVLSTHAIDEIVLGEWDFAAQLGVRILFSAGV